ncbi:hypothetical protein E2553_25275 [Paraburkholderia dipogonis]|uniref:Uncharacterized protein n=1 Tax=Paraburkholderia dipogonis TaxID=1211383 RepID=A0A4Y8MRR5_9BURK|nr:hypothetical protein [Paraburkholderia dipogonis]TFE40098.1 hypothetical protein E2553_25275 [Paraburkholderia dipogonis]
MSRHHVDGNAAIEQGRQNEGSREPQHPRDHPQGVAGAAQHRVRCITDRVLLAALQLSRGGGAAGKEQHFLSNTA